MKNIYQTISGEITESVGGQGISCHEVCAEEVSSERISSKDGDMETDTNTGCVAVLMDNSGDPDQAARDICASYSQLYEKNSSFCQDPNFLPPSGNTFCLN